MKPNRLHFRIWGPKYDGQIFPLKPTGKRMFNPDAKDGEDWALSLRGTLCNGYTDGDMIQVDDYEKYIVMQSTGLLDKNGKEIFEGDIVKHIDYGCTKCYPEPGDPNLPYDSANISEVKFYEETDFDSGTKWVQCSWITSDDEVVGNIYENPELLK